MPAGDGQEPPAVGEIPEEAFSTLPAPLVIESTNTAIPATSTPEATATPEMTSTPAATSTATPAPIPPTAPPQPAQPTSPPPPTNTAAPAPPPPPLGANGLTASHFALQDRSNYSPGGSVWFEFAVANSTGGEVPYNALGVMPKKDGVDRLDWYQDSYGGPNSTMKPGGLTWEDRIKLPETGKYTLRLVICFDGVDNCRQGRGTWHSLSQEIPIEIK
jgi:hypothetical protein